ncbi:MAG: SoxR reducing system RseC family protein [Pseudomonadales bacterium]
MNEFGKVVALDTASLWVETSRQTACGSCSAKEGCGNSLMERLFPDREHFVRVLCDEKALDSVSVGDRVEICVPDGLVLQASLILYFIPLAGLLFGAILGQQAATGDLFSILGAIIGLAFGIGLVRLHAWKVRNDPAVQPSLVSASHADPIQVF